MRWRSFAIIAVAATVGVTGCRCESGVDLQAEAETIRALDRQWQAAVDAKDVTAAAAVFAPDGIVMPANGPMIVGREGIEMWFSEWLVSPEVSNSFAPDVIEVAASGDLAHDRGSYRFVMDTPEGRIEDVGKYVVVWKKIDGEWLAALDISNSDLPVAGEAPSPR
jgi:uncharacterized protein (TIGR02246 family)